MAVDVMLFVAKVHDDNKRIGSYSKKLLDLVRKEFSTRNISYHDYERFVNILQCLNLQTEETRKEIDDFLEKEMFRRTRIDVRV